MLRILTLLSFLLLALPMYQTCSDNEIWSSGKKATVDPGMIVSSDDSLKTNRKDLVVEEPVSVAKKYQMTDQEFNKEKEEQTWNGYKIIKSWIIEDEKFNPSLPDSWYSLGFFVFPVFFLLTLSLFVLSFFNKTRLQMQIISFVNLLLIVFSYGLILFYSDDYKQIKYGFYLLILNSGLLFIFNKNKWLHFNNNSKKMVEKSDFENI